MEDISLRSVLFNKDINDKEDAFQLLLIDIEKKHAYWFEQHKDLFNSEIIDSLKNHYYTNFINGRIGLGFWPESELPMEIQQECLDAFKAIYSNNL